MPFFYFKQYILNTSKKVHVEYYLLKMSHGKFGKHLNWAAYTRVGSKTAGVYFNSIGVNTKYNSLQKKNEWLPV